MVGNIDFRYNYDKFLIRIHYVRSGTGTEPVLLLPGALGSALSDFSPQFEGISKV